MRPLISFLFLLVLVTGFKHSNAQWAMKGTISGGRWGAHCFSVNDKIYLGGGYKGGGVSLNDLAEYDPVMHQWSFKANMPGSGNRTGAIAFSINGKGYVGLGSEHYNTFSAAFLNDLWEYDPASDSWAQKASLPRMGRHHAACFVVGGKAYVVGGSTGYPHKATNELWVYDPASDSWTPGAPYPADYIHGAMAFSLGENGYVAGGHVKQFGATDNGAADSALYQYNVKNDTWIKKKDLCRRVEHGVGFALNGLGYVGFGKSVADTTTWYFETFCKYNPATNTWDSAASFPGAARAYGVAAVANGKAYAGAGWANPGSEVYYNDWAQLTAVGLTARIVSQASNRMSIYPNPAAATLSIVSPEPVSAALLNIYGQAVRHISLKKGSNTVDVSALPDGVYLVKSACGTERIVVHH